jgi:hypothetical protein
VPKELHDLHPAAALLAGADAGREGDDVGGLGRGIPWGTKSAWCTMPTHLQTNMSSSVGIIIPNVWGKMFQTTNQYIYIYTYIYRIKGVHKWDIPTNLQPPKQSLTSESIYLLEI